MTEQKYKGITQLNVSKEQIESVLFKLAKITKTCNKGNVDKMWGDAKETNNMLSWHVDQHPWIKNVQNARRIEVSFDKEGKPELFSVYFWGGEFGDRYVLNLTETKAEPEWHWDTAYPAIY